MKVPVKGQMEEIRLLNLERRSCGGLDGALQNKAGNNEKPEKGSCLPFPLLKGQRRLREAGRMLRVVLRGKRTCSKSIMESFGLEKAFGIIESRCSRAQLHVQLHPGTLSGFASFFTIKLNGLYWK